MSWPRTTESGGLAVIAISRFAPADGAAIGVLIGITKLSFAESVDDLKLRASEKDAFRPLAVSSMPKNPLPSPVSEAISILPVCFEEIAALRFGTRSVSGNCA